MKRKSFIISITTLAAGLPLVYYLKNHKWGNSNPIITPDLLSNFCSEKGLREIGLEYRKLVPAENLKQKLEDLILTGLNGKKLTTSNKSVIEKMINNKIQADFTSYNTTIIYGWIISLTEARQCALLSLT